ncbi:hypothetical protein BKA66DRAFT_551954 [Pyrenochaeta sp. MPI-SDFR-AT-0127]|nr:hypothetical protein BKA66DRAFT_551954 [Pyrenochaeta sp. MPI-SDFR-AT-0127]
MPRKRTPHDRLQIELAHALGFPDYPTDNTAEPYINYITNECVGRTLDGHIQLLVRIVKYFQDESLTVRSIQSFLDSMSISTDVEYFADTKAGSQTRREVVEDTVLCTIGIWTMMLSSFRLLPVAGERVRRVTLAYSLYAQRPSNPGRQPYGESVCGLIQGSGLLPSTSIANHGCQHNPGTSSVLQNCLSQRFLDDLDSLESLSIRSTRLNAYTLNVFGAVDIMWTHNLSRHMLLSKRGGQQILEIFALPCALSATSLTPELVGLSRELAQEVRESYSLLFNAWPTSTQHTRLVNIFCMGSICLCWSCSAQRCRRKAIAMCKRFNNHSKHGANSSRYDPLLAILMSNTSSDWTPDSFPNLWSRIVILEQHLQAAKPWSIWVLFRDRRDTLQFWTFLFATVVVLLTVLQVALGVAQVIGSFT